MKQKYKKMGLAAAACTLLGINASQAAVTLTFSQVGADVTATWSGTYEVTSDVLGGMNTAIQGGVITNHSVYTFPDAVGVSAPRSDGGSYANSPLDNAGGPYVGSQFGYIAGFVFFPVGTALGDTVSPVGTITFTDTLLSDLGADSLSMFLAYTGADNKGESSKIYLTTSVSAIPEPASILGTAGLLAGGLMIRRRKLGQERG